MKQIIFKRQYLEDSEIKVLTEVEQEYLILILNLYEPSNKRDEKILNSIKEKLEVLN